MANPRKAEGTRWEVDNVEYAASRGFPAFRLEEGGSQDAGDVAIQLPDGRIFLLECKQAQALNIHKTRDLADTKATVAHEAGKLPWRVAGVGVSWKRFLEKEPGQIRRVRAGSPIVAVTRNAFFDLLEGL